jgi:uncharacterized protein (UPF0548 family)
MRWLFTILGMKPELSPWERREFWAGAVRGPEPKDPRDGYERVVARESPGKPLNGGPFARAEAAILAYGPFPPHLVTPVVRRAPVEAGDTVGTRFHFLPGVDLFFASRVIERVRRDAGRIVASGFTYRTLRGHPELGEETFLVEKDTKTGDVTVSLRSWSRPGTFLARVFRPLVRRCQIAAGRAALDHLERIAKGDGAAP